MGKWYKVLFFILVGMLSLPVSAQDTMPMEKSNELAIGQAREVSILNYKYELDKRWYLRTGFFTNLEPSFLSYHFNAGIEKRIPLGTRSPKLLIGLDAISYNTTSLDRHLIGGGPVVGFHYNINKQFYMSTELGAFGYENESNEFAWSWHRQIALMMGWRF